MRIVGIDPGLRWTGWGVIDVDGNRLQHVANGAVASAADDEFAQRLRQLFDGIAEILERYRPAEAAVEETFVNRNPVSTLKLGQARGVVLLAPALKGLTVAEYPANLVKKSVVGAGHAAKQQIHLMVRTLLGGSDVDSSDAADALAVAICHAHHRSTRQQWGPAHDRKPRRNRAKTRSASVVSGGSLP
tara:strand:+ start:32054 stop:32617 length:564 start_codon:yes stop_codon:yes gene_type:complete